MTASEDLGKGCGAFLGNCLVAALYVVATILLVKFGLWLWHVL